MTGASLASLTPTIIAVLSLITVVPGGAIVIQAFLSRSAAARHAVLFWALLVAGASPIFVLAARQSHVEKMLPQSVLLSERLEPVDDFIFAVPTIAVNHAPAENKSQHPTEFSVAELLLALWAIGAVAMLVRLGIGMQNIARIRRHAHKIEPEFVAPIGNDLKSRFGRNVPEILVSDRVQMPSAMGIVQPVVILPSPLPARLNQRELLLVLVHESAHAVRRDPLIGLYQRILAAIFWFHPLIHIANRLLNRVREDICDNYVLGIAPARDYVQTLLTIAEQFVPPMTPLLAPALMESTSQLELRSARILNKRRNTMTHLKPWKTATIAATFIAAGLGFGGIGASTHRAMAQEQSPATPASQSTDIQIPVENPPTNFPFTVAFETGAIQFDAGNRIDITEVKGTSDEITPGNFYQIKGNYTLASADAANIGVSVTAANPAQGRSEKRSYENVVVQKGSGSFTLILPVMVKGWPHVSFNAVNGGDRLGTTYFGKGDTVLRNWNFKPAAVHPVGPVPTEFPSVVPFEIGKTNFENGDSITIVDVHGTSDAIAPGGFYKISGTYKLASHDGAMLATFSTSRTVDEEHDEVIRNQMAQVNRGEGNFTLILPMTHDYFPHISFYPSSGGESFGGIYFGTGDSVMKPDASGGIDQVGKPK